MMLSFLKSDKFRGGFVNIGGIFKSKTFSRLGYYLSHYHHFYLRHDAHYNAYKKRCYALLDQKHIAEEVSNRLGYCNRISTNFILQPKKIDRILRDAPQVIRAADLSRVNIGTMYRYDLMYYLKFFPAEWLVSFEMGDVTHVPDVCRIVKSRPIDSAGKNSNAVLMKLDRLRHFGFVHDPYHFADKKNKLVWRGTATQPHRISFLEKCFELPCCDVAQVKSVNDYAFGDYMTIAKQLTYKYVLCIEGNDVATNLKWAMSSRSLCFMVPPSYETWFMEGRLQAGVHYVALAPDYNDLSEKVKYYNAHPVEANQIIDNANKYVDQFKNKLKEDLLSLLVLEKFFYYSGQVDLAEEMLFHGLV